LFRPSTVAALAVSALALCLPVCIRAQTTINVPTTAYPTIQSGINAAANGDTVLVAPGTYVENILLNQSILVISSGGAAVTTIDGSALGPVVTVVSGASLNPSLRGFTIQNGGKPQPNSSTYGGIYVTGGQATITNNIITKTFCTGILAYASNVDIDANHINNTLTTGCTAFEGLGSGITIAGNGTLPNNAFVGSNTIEHNTASVAYSADKGGGGGINITNAKSVTMTFNTIDNNTTTGYGGAVYVATTPSIYFINNLVFGNKGVSGGLDIVVPGSSVGPLAGLLANNTIVDNTATASTGGSDIYIGGNLAQYALVNNIIVGDVAGEIALDCGTTYANQTITPLILDHNDIYSAVGTAIGGACTSAPAQDGNISADPQFIAGTPANVTADTQNFQILTSSSPVVDSGNNSVPILYPDDLAGAPRVQDATSLKYPVVDMGAYEFTGLQDASPTDIYLSPSTYTPITGSGLTLTATLFFSGSSNSIPTGTVTFTEDYATVGTGIISSSGTATYTINNLTAGLHTFIATYPGQGIFTPATSVNLLLNATSPIGATTLTTLVSSLNPSNVGQPVTFTATVSTSSGIIPTGQVEFSNGSTTLGIQPVSTSGTAALTTSTLPVGTLTITAAFVPSGTFNGSATSLTQVVNGAGSVATLVVNPTTAAYGSPITATATVAPAVLPGTTPTGTVTFLVDGAISGQASLPAGVATIAYSNLPAGVHTFGCTYSGDGTYGPSVCNSATATVTAGASALALSSSKNPSPALTAISFTATLTSNGSPVSGATVTIGEGSSVASATTNASGVATTNASLPAGTYSVTATFAGNNSAAGSSAQLTEIVTANPTSLSLAATPNPAYQGQPVTFTASLSDTAAAASPYGTVTFYDAGSPIGSVTTPAVVAGNPLASVAFVTSSLAPGTHSITAVYTPDANSLSSSSAAVSVVILPSSFTFTSAAPSITIETQHHASLGLTVTSIGGFSGPINLACGAALPPVVTCELAPQVSLPANGSVGTTLTLDTDAVLDFKSSVEPTQNRGSRFGWIAFASVLPLMLFGLSRRRSCLRLVAVAAIVGAGLTTLTGCSGKYPASTPPGTYTIVLTATGTPAGGGLATTQIIDLTLIVTP